MKQKTLGTVLFDFDGTIAQTLHLIYYLPEELLRFTALEEITEAEIEYLRKHGLRKFIKTLRISPLRLPKLLSELQTLFAKHMHHIPLVEGMPEVLESLKNKPVTIGIITSNSKANVEQYLAYHKLDVFSFVYADRNIFGKHRTIKKVLKAERISRGSTIYIGDEVRDVQAAHKSGIPAAAVSWGFNHREALEAARPDFLADKPEELLHSLLQL